MVRGGKGVFWAMAAFGVALLLGGCGSTRTSDTPRTGMEQLLLSNAVDHIVDGIDFSPLADRNVFVDDQYLECVDKKYVVGAIRHRAFRQGARLVAKPEDADLVLEIHAGAIGTDKSEGFIGMPGIAMPGPMPLQIPEIKLLSQSKQIGTAKIGLIAYDAKTREAIGAGGLAMSRADNNNWYFMGIGPFTSGRVHEEIASSTDESLRNDLKKTLRAVSPFPGDRPRPEVSLAARPAAEASLSDGSGAPGNHPSGTGAPPPEPAGTPASPAGYAPMPGATPPVGAGFAPSGPSYAPAYAHPPVAPAGGWRP